MRNLPPVRRRTALAWAGLLVTCTGLPPAAHAGFNFFTSEYTASRDELQAMVARRFPLEQGYGELVTVRLADPGLGLDPAANRAALTAQLSISSPLMHPATVEGLLSISSALAWDAPVRTLRLAQPQVERIELAGVTGRDAQRLQRIGGAVAQQMLEGQPLRSFSAEELTVGRKTYDIGDIIVLADGIKVQLK